jgi:NAD(P) transhydrogenase subunit beta
MNVLLAEVDVPYDKLYEIDDINPEFAKTDVVVVIGANDVVNPAAMTAVDTPIYGLPILEVNKASNVIVCNYDLKPGYAGVDNPLYGDSKTTLLLGDAKESLGRLLKGPQSKSLESVTSRDITAGTNGISEKNPNQLLTDAKRVIIVPGYGMALAQAQSLVKQLSDKLESNGTEVKFAIHPVAGRMPGHMNVLLAEVDVPYDKLYEIDNINPEFAQTDVVVVIGANDVINPAAHTAEDTPIYGLPILDVEKAKDVIICNFDLKPGYAGVDNPLYEEGRSILMLGDAKGSIEKLLQSPSAVSSSQQSVEQTGKSEDVNPKRLLEEAKRVIIVPGYGMALAQAQSLVKQLSDKLESQGTQVDFAIHPVAGRMPGHMNVLLAEVDVPYDKLYEIDDINPQFSNCDVAVVIGANDVVNPAAHTAEDTPIYGLPILDVEKAKNVIICNYDLKPGYAGVDNPLYENGRSILLLGDAKESLSGLL